MVSPSPADKLHIVTVNVFVIKGLYDRFWKCQDVLFYLNLQISTLIPNNKIKK